jgi:hypothetical protein
MILQRHVTSTSQFSPDKEAVKSENPGMGMWRKPQAPIPCPRYSMSEWIYIPSHLNRQTPRAYYSSSLSDIRPASLLVSQLFMVSRLSVTIRQIATRSLLGVIYMNSSEASV